MKKFFCSLGMSFCLVSSIFAHDNKLDILNSEITNILAPFQNENTSAKLKFDTVDINDERATSVAVNGLYSKIGSKNNFEIKADNLSYNYGDGKSPTTIIKGSIGFDFTKLLTRKESNQMIANAIGYFDEAIKDFTDEYGDAIFIKGVITSISKDNDGNYTGLTALLSTRVDLSKLPEDVSRESVLATDASFSIAINIKTGIAIDAFIVSNPEYVGFQRGNMGLKELLGSLLESDQALKETIEQLFMGLDSIASSIVEMDNPSFLSLILNKISLH